MHFCHSTLAKKDINKKKGVLQRGVPKPDILFEYDQSITERHNKRTLARRKSLQLVMHDIVDVFVVEDVV